MGLLFDSFWRAAAYCLRPRVIALSLLPLVLMALLAMGLGYFYWDASVQAMRTLLDASSLLASVWGWLQGWGLGDVTAVMAPLMVVLAVAPVLVVVSLLAVAVLMTPALVALVAARRFPDLERKKGGSFIASVAWSVGSTVLALVALVVSVPLWLVPPLVLVLPPLIWGWLTYRVLVFDTLADWATPQEREQLLRTHRPTLLTMGVIAGYLGAAPAALWALGVLALALAPFILLLSVWIYTLVFAFAALWFAHFLLPALSALRAEASSPEPLTPQVAAGEPS